MTSLPTLHATAVLVGARALLIRGPSGSGKSRLALRLIQAANEPPLTFVRLVADDRVVVTAVHGRLVARPPEVLAGLLEVRGMAICKVPYEPLAALGWVADLAVDDGARLPEAADGHAVIAGVPLRRVAVATGVDPVPLVRAMMELHSTPPRPTTRVNIAMR